MEKFPVAIWLEQHERLEWSPEEHKNFPDSQKAKYLREDLHKEILADMAKLDADEETKTIFISLTTFDVMLAQLKDTRDAAAREFQKRTGQDYDKL